MNIAVVEKEADVSEGSSKANNGMIHPGNAVMPFTLKAKMNLEGNKLYTNWADDLHFSFKRTGSLIISYSKNDLMSLLLAYIAGKINRVPGMKLLAGKNCMDKDPSIEKKPRLGLWTPTTAYVDGYEVCIALAENAAANGVRFFLDSTVCAIHMDQGKVTAAVTDGLIHAAAIQSPGLAAAPAVAGRVVNLTKSFYARTGRQLKLKDNFDPVREKPQRFAELSHEEQERLIKENPQYGNVICRCETITEGEIVAALHSPLPCRTVTGVKKRTRASAGRCQGGDSALLK